MSIAAWQEALSALHFLRPYWLLALLALPLPAWWWYRQRRQRSVWRDAVDPHLLPHLLAAREGARGALGMWALLGAFALAVLALAGPSWRKSEQPLLQNEAPLVIALDLSSATLAADLPPSRLLQARAKIATLLKQRAGGQVALVAFAGDTHTVAPLTDDAGNVALFLDALTPDIMPVEGSNAASAIAWSARLIRQAGYGGGDILLLTDHADAEAQQAARQARDAGMHVSVLGLGSEAGSAYRTAEGRIERTRLDSASLRELADGGGGRYQALSADARDLEALGVLRPQAGREAVSLQGDKASVWKDDGYWLLLPLLLLMLPAFRRGSVLAAFVVMAWLPLQPAHAADDGTLWRRADQRQHEKMREGVDAYRKRDYANAERAWKDLPGADAAYNRGNAFAQAGKYQDAIAAYDEALRQQPAMADAIANRKAVLEEMKRKPPPQQQNKNQDKQQKNNPGNGQSNPQNSQKNDSDSKPQDGEQQNNHPQNDKPSQDDRQQQPQPQGQQPTPPSQDTPSQPKPDDAEAQRKADAEQRARMEEALRKAQEQKNKGGAKDAQQRDETPAERERRQASDAWLRRVPDDPGGLLRAKFRLEYERRQETGER